MPSQNTIHKIYISRTNWEWQIIEQRLQDMAAKNKNGLGPYITRNISKIKEEIIKCPGCFNNQTFQMSKKGIYINPAQYEIINEISMKTNIPESTLVNNIIIEALLHP